MLSDADELMRSLVFMLLAFAILATPIVTVILEMVFLLVTVKRPEKITRKKKSVFFMIDLITIFLAVVLQLVYLAFCNVMFEADWQTQLYNAQKHQPIFTGSLPTFITIAVLGAVGFCILNLINVNKTPPLIPVLAMSAMYLGVLLSVVFAFHVIDFDRMGLFELYLVLPPIVFTLMSLRTILGIIREYAPDAAIKAFTETADFRLSQKIPPQQLYYDEHYLCTVTAGGDKKIVKPLEWIFLIILYLTDIHPEDRIALQYTGIR